MALQGSGAISFNNINVELGISGTATISLNDTAVRTLAGVASGAISMSNFYGKSSTVTINLTIAANTPNYNIRNAAVAAGWNGTSTLSVNVTINSGVYVYSTSTGSYALQTGTGFPAGSTISLTNNGIILGMGGGGGKAQDQDGGTAWTASGAGGPALLLSHATTITNNGIIAGGGGGGGGGK